MRVHSYWHVVVMILTTVCHADELEAQQRPGDRERDANTESKQREQGREDNLGKRQRDDERPREGEREDRVRLLNPRLLPPRPDHDRKWYLGVEVDYRDIGAQISRVERQSPAHRAGIETRDVIVTVRGYQVGRVDGRLYRLDRELELRADRRGHVALLVQNHRNGQLTPLTVRLEPADRQRDPLSTERIVGTVSLRRLTTLARGAVLTVRLLDVTDRRLPAQAIARQTLRELGPLPIPFELTYDKGDIKPGRNYALDAEVTVNGLAALRSERHPVLKTDRQGRVNLVLEPARR